jgi:hypothetical protein
MSVEAFEGIPEATDKHLYGQLLAILTQLQNLGTLSPSHDEGRRQYHMGLACYYMGRYAEGDPAPFLRTTS